MAEFAHRTTGQGWFDWEGPEDGERWLAKVLQAWDDRGQADPLFQVSALLILLTFLPI